MSIVHSHQPCARFRLVQGCDAPRYIFRGVPENACRFWGKRRMSPKNMEIKYKNTSYFEDCIRCGLFLFVTHTENTTKGDKRNDAEQRLPLGGKLSAELTDEGFVNLFKDKYNDASHLPLIR
ncbi:MAG: hypothetical protein IKT34_04275, partial [Clostridia bacterium]|nr:hypothetical protein [Clostridia bacterium]